MAEENVITRVTNARRDLKKLRTMVEQCYAILCKITGWNPKEGLTDEEAEAQTMQQVDMSSSKELVKLLDDDLLNLKSAQSTVDAATKEACKTYAKKIAQLTHTDKIMRFSAVTKAQLLEIFHDSQDDLADFNYSGLVYAYIHVRILRGESRHVPSELFDAVEAEYEWVNKQIQYIFKQPFVPAANAYCDGKIPLARMLFMEYIELVRKERAAVRAVRATKAAAAEAVAQKKRDFEAANRQTENAEPSPVQLETLGEENDIGGMALDTERAESETRRIESELPEGGTYGD